MDLQMFPSIGTTRPKSLCLNTGDKMFPVDHAVFYWQNEQYNITGVLGCHVDDFLWARAKHFASNVISVLKPAFHVGHEEHDSFSYVGMDIATVVQVH